MNDCLWITRVPETIGLTKKIIESIVPDLMETPDDKSFRSLCTTHVLELFSKITETGDGSHDDYDLMPVALCGIRTVYTLIIETSRENLSESKR